MKTFCSYFEFIDHLGTKAKEMDIEELRFWLKEVKACLRALYAD